MSGDIEFGELPRSGRRRGRAWSSVADQLRARPGEWARVRTTETAGQASSVAYYAKLTLGSDFEATARGTAVWARYIGGAA